MTIPDECWRLCYVAYFDILGISRLLRFNPLGAAIRINLLNTNISEALLLRVVDANGRKIPMRTQQITFPDSVFMYTIADTDDDLQSLLPAVRVFFCLSFGAYPVPLRGGIKHGLMCISPDQDIYTGPALLDAYCLSEYAQWIGVSCCEETARRSCNLGMHYFVPTKVPLKEEAQLSA